MALTRRAFLAGSAGAAAVALSSCGGGSSPASKPKPKLLWSEEFDALDLASPTNPLGKWRPNDTWQPLDRGYVDFNGDKTTWLVNPAQQLTGTDFNPFSVQDSVLSISVTRTPQETLADVENCPWLGGLLVSNTVLPKMVFGYGYYEFRARLPTPGRGMFPALWFYAARNKNSEKQSTAEIDVFEIFGSATGQPFYSTLHGEKQTTAQIQSLDTRDWHVYGFNWTRDSMDFYYDREHTVSVRKDAVAFFRGAKMAIRLDYVMDARFFEPQNRSDASTPNTMTLDLDYIRQYDRSFS